MLKIVHLLTGLTALLLSFVPSLSNTTLPIHIVFLILFGIEVPSYKDGIFMLVGGIIWISPFFMYYKAIEFEEPSRVVLLMQMTPIFIMAIAFFMLGEVLTLQQVLAFALLLIGGTIASVKTLNKKIRFSKAFLLMAGATFLWGLSDVIFKKTEMNFESFFSAFTVYLLGSFLPAFFILFSKKARSQTVDKFKGLSSRAWGFLASDQLLGISGSACFAYALTLGKASLTGVIIGVQPLLVFVFGLLLAPFFHEFHRERVDKNSLILKGISFILILIGLIYLQE